MDGTCLIFYEFCKFRHSLGYLVCHILFRCCVTYTVKDTFKVVPIVIKACTST